MPNVVHVHTLDLDCPDFDVNQLHALLDGEEAHHSQRFHSEQLRRRFIVRRGKLRELLSDYADCSPADIHFLSNEFGKPFLEDNDLQFNVSHSGNICLVAVARGREVGCDIERRDPTFPSIDIARAFFAPAEVRTFMMLEQTQQVEAFFNCWTRKEAYIKACGYGVSFPLDKFEVSLTPGEPAALLRGCGDWSVKSFRPSPAFQAAVVARGTEWLLAAEKNPRPAENRTARSVNPS
jgi:4'-phosphopantetheinyl transferase